MLDDITREKRNFVSSELAERERMKHNEKKEKINECEYREWPSRKFCQLRSDFSVAGSREIKDEWKRGSSTMKRRDLIVAKILLKKLEKLTSSHWHCSADVRWLLRRTTLGQYYY
jgi:hypothetical protein